MPKITTTKVCMRDVKTFSQGAQKLREVFHTQNISDQTKKGVLCLEQ